MPFATITRPDMPDGLVVAPTPQIPTPKVVGNGAAIQAQLDRIASGGSGELRMQAGIYTISTPLLLPDSVGSSGNAYRLCGSGLYATVLQPVPGFTGPVLRKRTQAAQIQEVCLEDFCVDGTNGGAGVTYGIDLGGFPDCALSHLLVKNCAGIGIGNANAVGAATGAIINGCIISGNGSDGINSDSFAFNVQNCIISGNTGRGLNYTGSEGIVLGNSFDGNLGGSLIMQPSTGDTIIKGNWFADIALNSVYLFGSDRNIVTGNHFQDNGTKLANGSFILCAGNNNIIGSNLFHYTNVTAPPVYSISVNVGVAGNIFGFNHTIVDGAATGADVAPFFWTGAGAGNTYIGNSFATATGALNTNDPTGLFSGNYPAIVYNPVALAAITLTGSPLTYTNTENYPQMVYGSGTATSAVSIIRNSVTTAVGTVTPWAVRLEPGDAVLIAYTGTPVFVRQAVR